VRGKKNVVADTLSRIELPDSPDDTDDIDDKVEDINEISQMSLDCDLTDRSEHVWAMGLDSPASDNLKHDEIDDEETNTQNVLDDNLSLGPNISVTVRDRRLFPINYQ